MKRYEPDYHDRYGTVMMREDHLGDYVLYEDVKNLLEIFEGILGVLTAKQRERQFPNLHAKARAAINKAKGCPE